MSRFSESSAIKGERTVFADYTDCQLEFKILDFESYQFFAQFFCDEM